MDKKTQIRGNCQCCGGDQAVVGSRMSKHGYTVKNGWFQGVCSGQHYAPLQQSRVQTDAICLSVEGQVAELRQKLEGFRNGTVKPTHARPDHGLRSEPVPFKEAPAYFQTQAVESAIHQTTGRINQGECFVRDMRAMADRLYGTALREVEVTPGPAPIRVDDKRNYNGRIIHVTRVDGARIYWRDEKGLGSWMGSSAWRRLPLAA